MSNSYFSFKQFTIRQEGAAFKVGTDGVLLGACADISRSEKILDIGTGTGLIAIMAAQRSQAFVTAIEPEEGSYLQAIENVRGCPWTDRITVIKSDLSSFASNHNGTFDLIITNPPFFRDSLLSPDNAKSFARHTFSLDSGDILSAASKLLNSGGSLQLILPYSEGMMFAAEAAGHGLFCSSMIKVKPAPAGRIKRLIMKFQRDKTKMHERFLTIETGTRHHFTDEYKQITGEFYLKF